MFVFYFFIETSSHSPFSSLTDLEFTVQMKRFLNSQRSTCHSLPIIEITVYATTFIELCFKIYCLLISIFYTHNIIKSYLVVHHPTKLLWLKDLGSTQDE